MMRLIVATKPMEGIKGKIQTHGRKIGQKYFKNHEIEKQFIQLGDGIDAQRSAILIESNVQGVKNTTTSSHSLEDWRDLSLSLLSSLTA
jgi:hypothetical protein